MTENNNPSTPVAETSPVAESVQQTNADHRKGSNTGAVLSTIAIILVIALGAGGYYYTHNQNQMLLATNQTLQQQLTELKQSRQQENSVLESALAQQKGVLADLLQQQKGALAELMQKQKEALAERMQQQDKTLDTIAREQVALTTRLDQLQDRVAAISGNNVKSWLLAQADFLVKLANRKLWSEQDVTTAGALLKNADASLAEMNDLEVIAVRRAMKEDLSVLSAIPQIDFDGIIIQINQLINQVDNLRLEDGNRDQNPMEGNDSELSSSLSEWRQNLTKSWHKFMSDFVTIRHRDVSDAALLTPDQDLYLRENIRSRLLIAAQAIPRHQHEVYQQSLETVSTWVRAYFDTSDPTTNLFLTQLNELSQKSISITLPKQLKSQSLLENLMQTRGLNLSSQGSATHQGE